MNEKDLDWSIYHLLAAEPGLDIAALSNKTGCSTDRVAESLARLEKYLLIQRREGSYRICSVQEMLLSCQSLYDERAPFVIENGIIRERKKQE